MLYDKLSQSSSIDVESGVVAFADFGNASDCCPRDYAKQIQATADDSADATSIVTRGQYVKNS